MKPKHAMAGPAPSVRILEGLRIVLVDDSEDARALTALVLRDHGAEVTDVSSACAAFDLVVATAPDVIVSDIAMPHEDGHSLIRRIRALPGETGLTPALALTAFADPQDKWRAAEAGFDAHVAKGVGMGVVVRAVRRIVRVSGVHAIVNLGPPSSKRWEP